MKEDVKVGDIVAYDNGDQFEIVAMEHPDERMLPSSFMAARGVNGTAEKPFGGKTTWWKINKDGAWHVVKPAPILPPEPEPIKTIVPEYIVERKWIDEASAYINSKIPQEWELISVIHAGGDYALITMVKFHEHYEFGEPDDN